ncbi:MAG: carboxypeptidase regulatory-like domain-containing protein [Acidobacteria bacterium]|nr:carboxypeptidase regulatory-like domain-containing protein [Acidobacteriota bacterium]
MLRTKLFGFSSLTLALVLAGCGGGTPTPPAEQAESAPAAAPSAPIDPATAATITGKIAFEGAKPTMARIRMDAVPACTEANKEPVYSEEVVVNDNGTLRDVYVYVKEGLGDRTFPVPAESVKLEQLGCNYKPHVLGIMAGQKFEITNDDPTNHNVHPLPNVNREWNQSQPPGAPPLMQEFARPEVMIPIKCNVHPWMKAYVGVQKHPFFAVTGADGTFNIKGLPPGNYTIEAWQEKYGAQTMQVTVGPSETKTADFSFKG